MTYEEKIEESHPIVSADNTAHYRKLFERHMAESERYQAMLYHAWRVIRQQQKGLRRQSKKIKRLQQQINKPDI